MSRFFNRFVLAFFLFAFLLFLTMYLTQNRTNSTTAEQLLRDTLAPLQSGVNQVSGSTKNFFTSIFSFARLKSDNEELRQKVATLEEENNKLKAYAYQNIRLRNNLDFKDNTQGKFDLVLASVIAREPNNWFRTLTINKGKSDGLAPNMAVITHQGLVGRVVSVTSNTAEVLLILDPRSGVGGLVQVTREPGIIEGIVDNPYHVQMTHLRKDAPVRERQMVVTSGLGGIFPKDLPVGRVLKVQMEPNGLLKSAVIRPEVDFNRLEEVFVIRRAYDVRGGEAK